MNDWFVIIKLFSISRVLRILEIFVFGIIKIFSSIKRIFSLNNSNFRMIVVLFRN